MGNSSSPSLETLKTQLAASSPSSPLRRVLIRKYAAESLRSQITACRDCPLGRSRKHAVPFSGPTHGKADIVIVGEAPGAVEDSEGVPFVGRSGKLLDLSLKKAGGSRSKVMVLNTLCCRPPNNRDPKPDELSACRGWFERQLAISKTWVGVALGGYALANILEVPRSSIRISDYLDKPVWKDGRVWFGTYHPAYALRNIEASVEITLSLRAALALRHGTAPLPPPSTEEMRRLNIVGAGGGIEERLAKYGWALIYSKALDDRIVVVADEEKVAKMTASRRKGRIPDALAHTTRYTLEELLKIGQAGASAGGMSKATLRTIHLVKGELGGEVII